MKMAFPCMQSPESLSTDTEKSVKRGTPHPRLSLFIFWVLPTVPIIRDGAGLWSKAFPGESLGSRHPLTLCWFLVWPHCMGQAIGLFLNSISPVPVAEGAC